MLLGIRDTGGGLGNNADEIETATRLFDNIVIRPYQLEIIEALDEILAVNGIALNLYFKTIQPLDFIDVNTLNATTNEEETGVKMASHEVCCSSDNTLDDEVANDLIDLGETPNEKWLLIDESEVDYDADDAENELLNKETKQSLLSKVYNFVSTGSARPNAKSEQDENIDGIRFITRYVYAGETNAKSRLFCKKMTEADKIYRKEDIIRMSEQAVNKGWGPRGSDTYSIWLYKGGGACHHRWNKQVYASFEGVNIDVNSPKARIIAGAKAEAYGYTIKNAALVSQRPIDMPNKGFLPKNN
jgi:hypothetical protein